MKKKHEIIACVKNETFINIFFSQKGIISNLYELTLLYFTNICSAQS